MSDTVNPFKVAIFVDILPSLQKYLIVSIPHFFAVFLLISVIKLPVFMLILLLITTLVSFFYYLQLHCLHSLRQSIVFVQLDSMNQWHIRFANQSEMTMADLQASSFISNYLIILSFRTHGGINSFYKNYSVLITKDSLSSQKFRILKTKIRYTSCNNKKVV